MAAKAPPDSVLIVNKIDVADEADDLRPARSKGSDLGVEFADYFPVSAMTGRGVDALVGHLLARMPEGPPYYPEDMVTDVPEAFWVAELVREQLLAHLREELPHSIATRVTEWEWPRIRVEILVERDSQKGIVIGKKGSGAQAGRHRGPQAAPRGRLPRALGQGRQGLAAPRRHPRPPRLRRPTG